ncbi:DUF2332 domain-containing protein [Streptacidiphilus sp. PB12-B1b]|uniref:DUF2332 domain-containing protein n=1 Tax=Streptacidiphilus sp. PB12-B1b TaxID=2705012 RepID=UPI0015FD5517|nr:DUF2332 domain-containing protein [Streptacidiphilus sp. PB12-B1b]QMU77531.1 DUF2332 domain-containing protein [Streptacidiphilus sp. PB12-B1b]
MTAEESRERAAAMVEWQARACADLGSRLYADLLTRAAADVRSGGPCAEAVAGYEDAPGPDAIALRLAGGVHALVLSGRAPELAVHYPSAGGRYDPSRADACWSAFRAAVAAELPWVRDWMTRPPQTNEVGRSNLLLAGLLYASGPERAPVRLFELGSSAGLNLRADHFRCTAADGYAWGPEDSPVVLADAWTDGAPGWLSTAAADLPRLDVVERRGCDPAPIDPLSESGALALRAYVWPDQTARHARLAGALALAARIPARVDRVGAADFLAGVRLEPGTLTVVWHSIMRQYVPAQEWARVEVEIDRLAAASTPDAAFAHIAFEPERVGPQGFGFRLTVRRGPGGERVTLADAPPHGLPATAVAPPRP